MTATVNYAESQKSNVVSVTVPSPAGPSSSPGIGGTASATNFSLITWSQLTAIAPNVPGSPTSFTAQVTNGSGTSNLGTCTLRSGVF
ncbi:MAG TPA: hypothetical protein VG871_13415 [Vicinamibacterales bacterium]|nr:hypothetical protein [Vicinamibacterales bacterium]